MAYGNLALDLILRGRHGRLVVLKNGRYDNMPIEAVTSSKKTVNVDKYYNKERLRPLYTDFEMQPLFIMASDYKNISLRCRVVLNRYVDGRSKRDQKEAAGV